MLVNDLKNEIKNYDKEDLIKIIAELYKRVPKAKKEEYDIDEFIKNINKKSVKTVKKETNFDTLKNEISYFLFCVDNDYYCTPNKIVSKKERSSWRFKVKKFYKELYSILPDSNKGEEATYLLIELFNRLSKGSNTLLFINWETFKALGVSQSNYYEVIIKRILDNGYTIDNLERCINLLTVDSDPYELTYKMFKVLLNNLPTVDVKENVIKLIKNKIQELTLELKNAKDYHQEFYLKELINNFVKLSSDILFSLHENTKAIAFIKENYIAKNIEVKEYIVLDKLYELNLITEWIKEYEDNINKVDLRNSLKEQYEELKQNLGIKMG